MLYEIVTLLNYLHATNEWKSDLIGLYIETLVRKESDNLALAKRSLTN